jgi:membrane associated rhomboid family serine protease
MRVPKITISLAVITTAFYVALSQSLLYIPSKVLLQLGFNFENPIGILLYSFLHVSPNHVIGNLILLFIVGAIAEQKLNRKDIIGIYFLSSFAAAITFSLLTPNTIIVGASAAISGLISAAVVADIKKAVVGIVAFTVLMFLIGPPLYQYSADQIELLRDKTSVLEQQLQTTSLQLEMAIEQNNTVLIEQLQEKYDTTYYELNESTMAKVNVEEGVEREKRSQTSSLAHIVGAIVGFIYLWRIRPDILWKLPEQVLPKKYLRSKKQGRRKK